MAGENAKKYGQYPLCKPGDIPPVARFGKEGCCIFHFPRPQYQIFARKHRLRKSLFSVGVLVIVHATGVLVPLVVTLTSAGSLATQVTSLLDNYH